MIVHKNRRTQAQELLNNGLRPTQIARELGVSRQYIYQLLGKVGRPPHKCYRCGKEFQRKFGANTLCEECHLLHARVTLTCPYCGAVFSLRPSDVRNRMEFRKKRCSITDIFCSTSCSMKWRYKDTKECPHD